MKKTIVLLENGVKAPLYRCRALVVGSGAAGLACAERLAAGGVEDVAVVTAGLLDGVSYRSGSDKQTYYRLSVFGNTPDSPREMARSLFDGGGMDGDIAYIESLYSLPAFYRLVEYGVPFPANEFGAFVGYKTDHDPKQRATSAGPKTSRYMVEALLKQVRKRSIPVLDGLTVVRLVTKGGRNPAVCGLVALDEKSLSGKNRGLTLFQADTVVLAAGGPGELYGTSVYPAGQAGLLGAALEAGADAVNLGEGQFGLTSKPFRWNLSGSYQQVIPSYFSTGAGRERADFLTEYYRNLSELSSGIFLKGYQWPFTAARTGPAGSSLIDLAVLREREKGNRVWLDFRRNPSYGRERFRLDRMEEEARSYLARAGVTQPTPYQRLAHLNPESIELYREHSLDLREPLEITVSFQHSNGGLLVDTHWQTTIRNLFAVGEIAGTHGVTRPGGAALNSGQVGAARAAEFIRSLPAGQDAVFPRLRSAGRSVLETSRRMLAGAGLEHRRLRREIQEIMDRNAGIIRRPAGVHRACATLSALMSAAATTPPAARSCADLARAWETLNLARTGVSFLKSIDWYLRKGGGSRGSYLVITDAVRENPGRSLRVSARSGILYLCRKERAEDRRRKIVVSGKTLTAARRPVKPLPHDDSWFETVWNQRRGLGG